MILKFKDIGDRAIKHYDSHMRVFGGRIPPTLLMELMLIATITNGEEKTIRQFKTFIRDMEANL